MSRNRIIYTVLLLLCVVGFWWFENFYTPDPYTNPEATGRLPFTEQLLPSSTYEDIVVHEYFMLSYSEPHEQAEWVAYTLEPSQLTYDDRKRPYFLEDPKVETKSADWRNYRGSGFDRGHLCPAGDRRFSEYAYNETFYTSNIAPQDNAFNAGIWNRLEIQVRRWCKKYGTLHIITGGVLTEDLEEIGEEDVDVPNAFFKVIIRENGNSYEVLAFLLPHRDSNRPLGSFLVSLDELEALTDLDFFYRMDPGKQRSLEQHVMQATWDY